MFGEKELEKLLKYAEKALRLLKELAYKKNRFAVKRKDFGRNGKRFSLGT